MIWFLLVLGFAVRVIGIGFGLPDLYHADEPIIVNHAMAYGSGDLNPHFFKVPPLVSYLLFACYGCYYLLAKLFGLFAGPIDFARLFLKDPTSFYLIGRIVFGALLGTATVYLFYKLIDQFFSRTHALLSAFFLAFAFLHVRDSHYLYCDIPLLFVLISTFFPIFHMMDRKSRKDYILFGALLGIAVATKYNGVFILTPFLMAHFIQKGRKWFRFFDIHLAIAAVFALLSYTMLNPFSLIDFKFFMSELAAQGRAEGHTGFVHLARSLPEGLGVPLFVAALIGIGINPSRRKFLFLTFIVAYGYVLVFFSQPSERYVLPLVPFAAFFAANALAVAHKWRWSNPILFTLAFILILPSLGKIYLSDIIFLRKDTRSIAKQWIETSLPSGSRIAIAYPFLAPRLKPTFAQLEDKQSALFDSGVRKGIQNKRLELLMEQAKSADGKRFELYFLKEATDQAANPFLFAQPVVPYDLGRLKEAGIHYVIVPLIDRIKNQDFYTRQLAAQGKLLQRFGPFGSEGPNGPLDSHALTGGPFLWKDLIARKRNGHVIEIYRLG